MYTDIIQAFVIAHGNGESSAQQAGERRLVAHQIGLQRRSTTVLGSRSAMPYRDHGPPPIGRCALRHGEHARHLRGLARHA